MPFKMKVETAPPQELLEPGIYTVKLVSFKPKKSEKGDSVNLNAMMEIIDNPDHFGAKLYENLNTTPSVGFIHKAFSHAFGLEVEDHGNGQFSLPGDWEGNENDPSTWKYTGPLLGREAQVEVGQKAHYKDSSKLVNGIRKYICKLPGCTEKHPEDLMKNS